MIRSLESAIDLLSLSLILILFNHFLAGE
jgi:hypothetical protein